MNTGPLKSYLEARESLQGGDRSGAARLLANSFGIEKPTPFMEDNLGPLLEANDVSLTLILKESSKDG